MSVDLKDKKKVAIILFNLGGPDKLSSVQPFLFNLFSDPAIMRLPWLLRIILAKIISTFRNKHAQKLYALIGNKSPILEETQAQSLALGAKLKQMIDIEFEIFICMRYWHPRAEKIVKKIKEYNPTELILLPLYPQFSTTTTNSSINEFKKYFLKSYSNNHLPIKIICCYPYDKDFIKAHISLIKESIKKIPDEKKYRILFSAHSLPVKIIEAGDPYQWQVEQTVKNIIDNLNLPTLDYKITYQSKVGPIEWLKPSTEDEIKIAAKENKALIIVPIAFVSEHVETLVELDIEYKSIIDQYNIPYFRVPALGINEIFIESLAKIVINSLNTPSGIISNNSLRKICPAKFSGCPCNIN